MKHLTDQQLDAAILAAPTPSDPAQLDAYQRALLRRIDRDPSCLAPTVGPVHIGDRVLEQRDLDSRDALLRSMVAGLKQHVAARSRSRSRS